MKFRNLQVKPAIVLKPSRRRPIVPGMESFLITLGYGLLALLGAAILVALLEHWRSPQGTQRALPPPAAAPRAAHVDIDLNAFDTAAASGDAAQRQATVDAALARMSRPSPVAADGQATWIETRPMVGMTAETEPR